MARPLWVAWLHVSEAVAEKLNARHALTEDEVRHALVCVEGLRYMTRPEDDGFNIQIWIRGVEHLAVIFPKWGPNPDDVYYLATAYPRRTR